MRKISAILTAAAAAIFLLASCEKEKVFSSGEQIQFGVGAQTKGLLNNANLKTDGTTVKVFDIITGSSGYSPTNNRHIDDAIQYHSASTSWSFISNPFYLWPATGSQRFFGWLAHDAVSDLDASDLVGSIALSTSDNKTLVVPASSTLTMTPSVSQFDFSYSNTVTRTGDADRSVVELQLEHLFTSFSFSAKNTSDNNVTIKALQFANFKNTNNATITFESTGTEVAYGAGSSTGTSWNWSGNVAVNTGTTVNNITGSASGTPEYKLMWPQPAANFTSIDYDEGTDTYTPHTSSLCYLLLTFNQGSGDISRYLGFPLKNWEAGKRNLFTIEFANKLIQLTCTVLPWEVEDVDIYYNDGTVQGSTIYTDSHSKEFKLLYDPARLTDDGLGGLTINDALGQSIVDDAQKKVYVKNGMPVKGRFNLNTPEGAECLISLTGDYQAFDVEFLTDNHVSGNNIDFQLVPKNTGIYASPTRDYEVNIRVALRLPSGRIVSADPVLQGPEEEVDGVAVLQNQYTIILPKA